MDPNSPNSLGRSLVRAENDDFKVVSSEATLEDNILKASVSYATTSVAKDVKTNILATSVKSCTMTIQTNCDKPRCGLLIVGVGGNNGSTLLAGMIANKHKVSWETREGVQKANWLGSLSMNGTTRLGIDEASGEIVYVPIRSLVPLLHPDEMVVGGWDISSMKMGDAMKRAKVLDIELQRLVYDEMQTTEVMPGIYDPTFIAMNQGARADNILSGNNFEKLEQVRQQIRKFKSTHNLAKIIVLWSGNTERYSEHNPNVHETEEQLMAAIKSGEKEIAPSLIYGMAAMLEECSYINGSPQNSLCPGLVQMARKRNLGLVGDDLKTGQTKMKSVITDYLVSAGLKPTSICSYNHLGNNDGLNLSAPDQFRSKEISKSNVVDDIINQNSEFSAAKPDHVVVIKYVPNVGDSKRALDEYTSEIFMNGKNTIVVHNTCEDSLLAAPIMLDLVIFTEFVQRVNISIDGTAYHWEPLLSLLSYWCKAPAVPSKSSVINSLFIQRETITNFCRACQGLPANSYLDMDSRLRQ